MPKIQAGISSQNSTEEPSSAHTLDPVPYDLSILPVPKRLRYDSKQPGSFEFGMFMNVLFAFALAANLYYCQPILIKLADSFKVTYNDVSRIPTLIQAGYAVGLLLITPLGDLLRRRQLILCLVICSTLLTIGLAATKNLVVFETLSFLTGVATVAIQVLLPLAADLAPPERRGTAFAIVMSGLTFGILIARVLSGIVAEFTSWRVVYYFAIAVQAIVLICMYLFVPDYPPKNTGLTYGTILLSMAKYAFTEPTLIQNCLMMIGSLAVFANFWVTLTFLLGDAPYHYSTLVIGLFGLVGMAGVSTGPFIGRALDQLVPWYGTLISTTALLVFLGIQVGAGGINVAAVIIVTFGLDVCRQMQQVSMCSDVFSISEAARSRLNAVLIFCGFIGQVIGTSAGTKIFVTYGWRACALFSVGLTGFQLLVLSVRGPNPKRKTWFGYEGGLGGRKTAKAEEKIGEV